MGSSNKFKVLAHGRKVAHDLCDSSKAAEIKNSPLLWLTLYF